MAILDGNREYVIKRPDFTTFARAFTEKLNDVNLAETCDMSFVRFYVCEHGKRETKTRMAKTFHNVLVTPDHPHVDVVQMHCGDNLRCANGDTLLVDFDVTSRCKLFGALRRSLTSGRLYKYRVGFLYRYGYFSRHGQTPRCDLTSFGIYAQQDRPSPLPPHPPRAQQRQRQQRSYIRRRIVQAYENGAKMARKINVGLFTTYTFGRGFPRERLPPMTSVWKEMHEQASDIVYYATKIFKERTVLRIEEVVTFDSLDRDYTISEQVRRSKVFDENRICDTTCDLLDWEVIVRLGNWKGHFDRCIGEDCQILYERIVKRGDTFKHEPIDLLYAKVCLIARAHFRATYFVHGHHLSHNHDTFSHMLRDVGETANERTIDIRPLDNKSDTDHAYTHYAPSIPRNVLMAVQCMSAVLRIIKPRHEATCAIACVVTWSYTAGMCRATQLKVERFEEIASLFSVNDNDENDDALMTKLSNAFTLRFFAERYAAISHGTYDVQIRGQYVDENRVLNAILRDCRFVFIKTLRATPCLEKTKTQRYRETLTRYFRNDNIQIVPAFLQQNAMSKSNTWIVVEHAKRSCQGRMPTSETSITLNHVTTFMGRMREHGRNIRRTYEMTDELFDRFTVNDNDNADLRRRRRPRSHYRTKK